MARVAVIDPQTAAGDAEQFKATLVEIDFRKINPNQAD